MATPDFGPLWDAFESLPPRGAGEHRYLLINQAAFGPSDPLLRRLSGFERAALLGRSVDACTDGATPFLVACEGMYTDKNMLRTVQAILERTCCACAISVLDSTFELESLANALTKRCTVRLPDDMDMVLRFFDTRIMSPLIDVLEPAERTSFFACATRWLYASREGQLDVAPCAAPGGHDGFTEPLELSQTQQNELMDAGEADLIIDLLLKTNIEPLTLLPVPKRYTVVSQFLASARQWGLRDTPDFAAYCCLALSMGADFVTLPPWRHWLPKVKAGDLSFIQALALTESEA